MTAQSMIGATQNSGVVVYPDHFHAKINASRHTGFMQGNVEEAHNLPMDTVGRQELEAKLEAIEARMETRVTRIEGKIDLLTNSIATLAASQAALQQSVADAEKNAQADAKSMKNIVIGTGVSTVVAIVLGVAAFNSTVLSNMVASFESGKNTAAALSQASQQLKEAQELLQNSSRQPEKAGK